MTRVLALLAALGFLGVTLGWFVTGGRWYVVDTPSMGTAAPVGTLLWSRPVAADELRPGDLITFRPPGESQTYSHRVLAIAADGTITTKGQLTAPDPWTLHAGDVLGRAEARWWGVGWLLRAAPFLLAGAAAAWLITRRLPPGRRQPVVLLGASVSLCVAIVVLHPLTGAQRLGTSDGRGTFVSTGLLPVRLSVEGAGHADLANGEVATIDNPRVGTAPVTLAPDLSPWWWVALAGVWLLPAAGTTLRTLARTAPPPRHAALVA